MQIEILKLKFSTKPEVLQNTEKAKNKNTPLNIA